MKARMERAELAIQKQRERQAKEAEKAKQATAAATGDHDDEDDGGGKVGQCSLISSNLTFDLSQVQMIFPLLLRPLPLNQLKTRKLRERHKNKKKKKNVKLV
jgi:hypothetical protein